LEEVTQETLAVLREKGRPTLLLSLSSDPFENYPESLKKYLLHGEKLGLPQRPLISQRKPWYKTEIRSVPPFLFAYLGRRNIRFIRNTAKIIPLTGFLCVYPKSEEKEFVERLWKILNHPDTIGNLALIGKSYGDGAIKVEPRALEKLPIPDSVIKESGFPIQMRLFEQKETYKVSTKNQTGAIL
jgi:adenine-specific DNA-methyltransferase